MKKFLLILLLMIGIISSILPSSLFIGFDMGYALNLLDIRTPWSDTEYRPGHGADFEFTFSYSPLSWLSLNTGLRYVQKSYIYYEENYLNVYYTVANYAVMNHFLELPLTIRFSLPITDNIKAFVGGGGFIGFWAGSNSFDVGSNSEFSFSSPSIDFEYGDNRFSAGVIAEAGFDFALSEEIRLLTAFKYIGSFTSLASDYQKNINHSYNDTFLFTVGTAFGIGG